MIRELLSGLKQFYLAVAGSKAQCNICGFRTEKFEGDGWHQDTICPRCDSGVRQRLLWAALFLPEMSKVIKGKRVLHFAPEKGLGKRLKELAGKYETADFFAEGYAYENIDHNLDISDMKEIPGDVYDVVVACDVLEHVVEHKRAMKELFRILRKGGCCILTIPQKDNLEKTIEDLSITDPLERELRFGQRDHLRIYGNDFSDMLVSAGFEVRVIEAESFSKEQVSRFVLFPPVLSDHPMATNHRKIFFAKKS